MPSRSLGTKRCCSTLSGLQLHCHRYIVEWNCIGKGEAKLTDGRNDNKTTPQIQLARSQDPDGLCLLRANRSVLRWKAMRNMRGTESSTCGENAMTARIVARAAGLKRSATSGSWTSNNVLLNIDTTICSLEWGIRQSALRSWVTSFKTGLLTFTLKQH